MLIVLCYKYLIMHVYIVQSDFHVRRIPFRGDHSPHTALPHLVEPPPACLSIPSGLGSTLEKMIFFALGTLVDPPLAPTVRGLAGPPAAPSDHWYGGLRVLLGDSEAWKPQKVGAWGGLGALGIRI